MRRTDRFDTAKILASLATAAGALAAQAGPAQATVFVTPYDSPVGYDHGAFIGHVPVGITSFFARSAFALSASSLGFARFLRFRSSSVGMRTPFTSSFGFKIGKPVPKGTTYSFFRSGGTSNAVLAARSSRGAFVGAPGSTMPYYDFQFVLAGSIFAGWLHGSLVNNSFSSLFFVLRSVAVNDVPGQLLPAGATSVPEPPSLALLGLGAMVTGAAATRRYKRARRAA